MQIHMTSLQIHMDNMKIYMKIGNVMERCQVRAMMPIALPIQKFRLKFFKRHNGLKPNTSIIHKVLRQLSSHHIPSHSMRVHLLLYICFCHCHVRYKVGLLLLLLLF